MASFPIPAKHEWRRAAETLSIATLGGIALNWFGFPAGLVTGSLLGVATAALCGRPVHIPVPLARVISVRGRHFARRRGDAGDAQGPRGISAERSGAGDFDVVHDRRDQLLSPLRPRLGRAIGFVRRKPRRARPGDDACLRIQSRPPRHRHRADHAGGGADPGHPRRSRLLRADRGGRRADGAFHRGRAAVDSGACRPGRGVHRHGPGVFQAAAAGRTDVRRHADLGRPARRRLYSLHSALVGGLRGGDRHRLGHRLAVRQHRSVHACSASSARRWVRSRWRW